MPQAVSGAIIGAITSATAQYLVEVAKDIKTEGRGAFIPSREEMGEIGVAAFGGAVSGAVSGGLTSIKTIGDAAKTIGIVRGAISATSSATGSVASSVLSNSVSSEKQSSGDIVKTALISSAISFGLSAKIPSATKTVGTQNSNYFGGNQGLITSSERVEKMIHEPSPAIPALADTLGSALSSK